MRSLVDRGFTLIENIIVITLLITLLSAGYVNFWNFNKERLLKTKAFEAKTLLDEAYVKATQGVAFEGDLPYKFGVCFKDQEYTLFASLSDWAGRDQRYSEKYELPTPLHFAAMDLPFACDDFSQGCVIFDAITGETLSDGSIVVFDEDTNEEYQITVSKTGLIEIQ